MTEPVQEIERRTLDEIRVLLVDDHDLFRTGLRTLLPSWLQATGRRRKRRDAHVVAKAS